MAQAAIESCLCARASAKYLCKECEQYFCDTCRISHKKAKVSKNHNLVEIHGTKEKELKLFTGGNIKIYGDDGDYVDGNESKTRFDADSRVTLEFVTHEGLVVKVYKKSITRVNVDAIVNAANEMLGNYDGIADIISRAAGYDMEKEYKNLIRKYGTLKDADNQVTGAGNLPYKGIIHAVGPRWSDYMSKSKCLNVLVETVKKILESARRKQFSSVAISSGIFAVPKRMCAAMYLNGILEFSKEGYLESLKEFHIIDIHDEILYMIKDWYRKYKIDPACIEVSAVLKYSDSDYCSPLNIPPAWQHYERGNKRQSDNLSESQRRTAQVAKEVMQARATDSGPTTTKVLPKFCGKTDILIYTGNVLQLEGIDAVVVKEDGLMKGEGELSKALLNADCDRYKKEHKKLQPFHLQILEYRQGTVLLTSGGDKLLFRFVLHAVLSRQIGEQEQVFQRKLQTTINNVLLKANVLNMTSKKGITVALPMMGLGSKPTEDMVMKSCWSFKETIEKYLRCMPNVRIAEIHLVNHTDSVTEMLQKYFDQQ